MEVKTNKMDILNIATLMFLIGCLIGNYYEQILTLIIRFIKDGNISWVSRSGLIYGPFSPIYGLGAILIFLLFCLKTTTKLKTFIYGAILGGSYEYVASLFQEKVFGSISWDYSNRFLNINGRTTIPYMIIWGLLVIIFVYFIYPKLINVYFLFKPKIRNYFCILLFSFFLFDIGISLIAVGRQTLRHNGIPAKTFIGEFCNKYYPDEYLSKIYENTKFIKNRHIS